VCSSDLVEDLKPLAREISQLRRVIQDTEKQFSHASQQVSALAQTLDELRGDLEKLASQMFELERGGVFPLSWDESSGLVNDLRKRLEAIGPVQQPRTPEQVAQHLKELERIRAGHKTHAGAFPKFAEQHRALVALLESPDIKDGSAWLRKASEMLKQAAVYDQRNWPRQDSVQNLPAELDDLSKFHEDLVPADRTAPIRESELSVRLQDTRLLADQHKHLRPRVENVQKRLAKMQALEKECKEQLTASFTALERVALLAENNDLLYEAANQEIERLSEEIRQLGNELNARAQGEIDKKAQKISAQVEKVNRALNGWLSRLNTAIAELGSQMNGLLSRLDAIAMLDDAIVSDTRDLLSRDEYVSAIYGSRGAGRPDGSPRQTGGLRGVAAKVAERGAMLQRQPVLNDLEITAEIKRKNDLWLTLDAVARALSERIETLLAAQEEAAKARSSAQEMLAEVAKRVPERRAWPPTNQTPLTEAQVLRPIDGKRDAFKKQPRRIDAVILELGRLAQQYQNVAEHARQVLDRATQDEERVQDLEEQIGEIKQRWQAHGQSNPGNPVMREGIQQIISQTDSKLAYIKQQYMRGSLSYEQVIRNLQLLYDELFSSRVSVDDKNDIGLNETQSHASKRTANQR
jgi:chromosome segregation ATPase